MFTKISSVGFPEKVEKIELSAILRVFEPTWEDAAEAGISKAEFDKLIWCWQRFEGPVRDVNHFMVCAPLGGNIYATATYDHGRIEIDVCEEGEIDRTLVRQVPFIGQRLAPKKFRQNEPCPCGSGKKFKKCCQGRRG
jgi:hypothetical protein